MNGGNIRLRMTLKINVGCLSLVSEMNGGNIPSDWLMYILELHVHVHIGFFAHNLILGVTMASTTTLIQGQYIFITHHR